MPDPAVTGQAGAWPPLLAATFLPHALALLEIHPVLVIVGTSGTGRHDLTEEIARLAAVDGPAPLRHAARHGQQGQPHLALGQLFAGARVTPGAPAAEIDAAVRAALTPVTACRPPVVLLADADLCDRESVASLSRLATTGDVRLIAVLTPETITHHETLLPVAEVIDLPPLTPEQIAAALQARFGVRPHPLLVSLLMERTGGSYPVLRDVADAASAAGLIFEVEGLLAAHPSMTPDALTSRCAPRSMERLGGGPEITALVELTALLGRLDADEARACVPPEIVDLALTHGAFTVRAGSLVLASPAEPAQVRGALHDVRRRELLDAFADRVPSTLMRPGVALRAADWWIACGRRLPVDLAARAAREANLSGLHYRAVLYTDPTSNEQQLDIAPLERAHALTEIDDDAGLSALWARLDPAMLDEDELLTYLHGIAHLADPTERDRMTARGLMAADPTARRRTAAVRRLAALVGEAFDCAGDDAVSRLRSLAFSAHLSPSNRAVTFTMLSAALRHSGRPLQAVEAAEFALVILAKEGDDVSGFHLSMARALHVMALISAVDSEGAERAIADCATGPAGHTARSPLISALETSLAMLQGDLDRALTSARLCLAGLQTSDPHRIRGWVEAMLAQILVHKDRPAEAAILLASAAGRPAGHRQLDLERRMKLAWIHDALADPEEALRLLADAIIEARRHGLRLALIDAAGLSVQIGGPPHLEMLLGAVDDLVEPSGVPLVWQTFARSAERGDLLSLIGLIELAEVSHARRFAAEVAQYILDTWRRRNDLDAPTRARLQELADPASWQQHHRTS